MNKPFRHYKQRAKIQNQPNLLQKIYAIKNNIPLQQVVECKYGVLCAHLRTTAKCHFPHRRNHFLFLNLVPPANCIPDKEEDQQKMTKHQRKESKLLEKAIKENIDVGSLQKREVQIKRQEHLAIRAQILENINEKDKKILQLVQSNSAAEYFEKLNKFRTNECDIFEMKKRSLLQIRKKNQALYKEIVDKQYRIANRLIKEASKNSKASLYEIYTDINHDTIASIRQYFEGYFNQDLGIPIETNSRKIVQKDIIYITKLLTSIFTRDPNGFKSQYYTLPYSMIQVKSNIEFYNLLVPFSLVKGDAFNKYIFLDCEQNLSMSNLSQLLAKDYLATFSSKCKGAPEYPFGQLQQNLKKFGHWVSKIKAKYMQGNNNSNIIFLMKNIDLVLDQPDLQQFEMQKLKQRQQTLKILINAFRPVVVCLMEKGISIKQAEISKIFGFGIEGESKFEKKVAIIVQ